MSDLVIPAKAGIQLACVLKKNYIAAMPLQLDSRLRGNDKFVGYW